MVGQRRVLALQMEKVKKTQNPDGFCGNVMTVDQVVQLRKQIAVYAVICEQLVDMHKAYTAQQDLAGMKMGSTYGDLMAFGGNKVTARQRWTPSNMQLEILERIYDEANGTPGKHRVKEITKELSQHSQVTETNVYNWFQNRRARTKRKQSVPTRNISDSDIEPEVISPKDNWIRKQNLKTCAFKVLMKVLKIFLNRWTEIWKIMPVHFRIEFDNASLIKHSMFSQELEMAIVKMEMGADNAEMMRMYESAQMAVEACEMELLEKTRKYGELMLEKHKKKTQIQQLDKIVRLKLAEADMFQLKANESKQEVLRLQRIALVSEEECANRYLRQRLREAEAEKRYLIEKIILEDRSQAS